VTQVTKLEDDKQNSTGEGDDEDVGGQDVEQLVLTCEEYTLLVFTLFSLKS
jgi:hypothetical protein